MTRRIYTKAVWQMTPEGYELLPGESHSYEYDGPVAECGSLAFAAGGLLAGGGAGIADAAKENLKDIMQTKLEQMREDYQDERQQKEIQAQQGLEQTREQFQHGETERGYQVGAAAAQAARAAEAEQKRLDRASREHIGAGHDAARLDAATVAAIQRSSTAAGKNGLKPLQSKILPANQLDPKSRPTPYTFDPNTGISYVQVGDRHYRMGPDGKPIDGRTGAAYEPSARNRTGNDDPTPAELQALAANPYGVIPEQIDTPKAFKGGGTVRPDNAGMTYIEAFEKHYGYVPSSVLGAIHQQAVTGQQPGQSQSQSTSIRLPSGRVFNVPAGFSLGGARPPGQDNQDQKDDSDGDEE